MWKSPERTMSIREVDLWKVTKEGRTQDMKRLVLQKGVDVNANGNSMKATALHMACSMGKTASCACLIELGADVNRLAIHGLSPLDAALQDSRVEIARMLLVAGADPNHHSEQGRTPLHRAAEEGSVEALGLLLDHGALVESEDTTSPGYTAVRMRRGGTGHTLSCQPRDCTSPAFSWTSYEKRYSWLELSAAVVEKVALALERQAFSGTDPLCPIPCLPPLSSLALSSTIPLSSGRLTQSASFYQGAPIILRRPPTALPPFSKRPRAVTSRRRGASWRAGRTPTSRPWMVSPPCRWRRNRATKKPFLP